MKTNSQTDKLIIIYNKFNLVNKTSLDDQKYILKNKKKIYNRILRSLHHYGIIAAILSVLYFFSKKNALLIVILKKIIITTAIISITGGSYIIINDIIEKKRIKEKKTSNPNIKSSEKKIKTLNKFQEKSLTNKKNIITRRKNTDNIKYLIRIKPFISNTGALNKASLIFVSRSLADSINKNKQKEYITVSDNINSKNAKYSLIGSIDKYNREIIINIKIINLETSSIELLSEEKVDSINQLTKIYPKISQRIRSTIE